MRVKLDTDVGIKIMTNEVKVNKTVVCDLEAAAGKDFVIVKIGNHHETVKKSKLKGKYKEIKQVVMDEEIDDEPEPEPVDDAVSKEGLTEIIPGVFVDPDEKVIINESGMSDLEVVQAVEAINSKDDDEVDGDAVDDDSEDLEDKSKGDLVDMIKAIDKDSTAKKQMSQENLIIMYKELKNK